MCAMRSMKDPAQVTSLDSGVETGSTARHKKMITALAVLEHRTARMTGWSLLLA